jgi:predicted ATP-grasp superfamily ATP-dependent carboligase
MFILMRVLLFEYITGGGLADKPLPSELAREGEIMMCAKLRDLAGKFRLKLLRDERLPISPAFSQAAEILSVKRAQDFTSVWQSALEWAQMVWVTAPETDGILAALSEQVLKAGKKLLGSRPPAVRLAGDKLATLHRLAQAKVECVPAWKLEDFVGQVPPPWVIKPRDGVGCEGVVLVEDLDFSAFPRDWVIQPFLVGQPISLSAVFADGEAVLLSVNRQIVELREGHFHLHGCEVNAFALEEHWQQLCRRIAVAIPGLWGYVGVDLVMTEKGAQVLEVNPRLTLSYAGLNSALGKSIGAWIVALAEGQISLQDIACYRSRLVGQSVWVRT